MKRLVVVGAMLALLVVTGCTPATSPPELKCPGVITAKNDFNDNVDVSYKYGKSYHTQSYQPDFYQYAQLRDGELVWVYADTWNVYGVTPK